MKTQRFTPPLEHELGQKVILGFVNLGVNDMKYTFAALQAAGVKKSMAKPKPTHRSKKDRKLTWTGRGSMPRWMREEMKALRLKPDAFLIRK